jgi:hypothetical protein
VLAPFHFYVGMEKLSKFELFKPDLEGDNFFFQSLFVEEFLKLSMFLGNGG